MERTHRTYHNCSDKFVYAIRQGDLVTVKEILYETPSWVEVNVKSSELQLLYLAVLRGHTDIVKFLLELGADVNFMNGKLGTLIHVALEKVGENTKEMCEILVEAGADVNQADTNGLTPTHLAIDKRREDVAQILIKHGADIKSEANYGSTLLHFAARSGAERISEILIEGGVDMNQRDTNGLTPTHLAIEKRCENVARVFLERGANVNLKTNYGQSLLHFAANSGAVAICQLLVEGGADVNVKDKGGLTPLHMAARRHHVAAMEVLLNSGADIDASDKNGNTALHSASDYRKFQAVTTLIENGANVNIVNSIGETAFRIAWSQNRINYQRDLLKMCIATNEGSLEDLGITTDVSEEIQLLRKYEEEVQKMKSLKINNTNVTFRHILTKSVDQIAFYLRNADVLQALRLKKYEGEFPEYARLIEGRFKRSIVRKELLDEGHRFFLGRLSKTQDLPYKCTDKILYYLSNRDLTNLKKSCSSDNNDVTKQRISCSGSKDYRVVAINI